MTLPEFFQHPAIPVLTFFIGLWVGHRTALWRDRRKELNDASEPVRTWLLAQARAPSAYRQPPSLIELDRLEQCLGGRRGRALRSAWERAEQVTQQNHQRDALGQVLYADAQAVGRAWAAVLPFTGRR